MEEGIINFGFYSLSSILQRLHLLALPGTCSQSGDSAGRHTDFDGCWEGERGSWSGSCIPHTRGQAVGHLGLVVLVTGSRPLSLPGWAHLSSLRRPQPEQQSASSLPRVSMPWYPKEGDGNFQSINCAFVLAR